MVTVNRNDLLSILSSIKPALAKRDIIPQAQHFIFANNEVFAYNDELFISHPFDTGLECSVRADEFYKILQRMSVDKLELTVDDGQLKIKAGKTRAALAIESDGTIFSMVASLDLPNIQWTPLAKGFIAGVDLCMNSASEDASQGALTCVAIRGSQLYSTDDARISWFAMESSMADFLLSARAAKHLVKFDVIEYCATDSWVHFQTKDAVVFSCRQIAAEFPDVEEFFEGEGSRIKLPAALRDTVERVGVMADGDIEIDRKITVCFETDKVICKGDKKGVGWIEEDIDTNYKQAPIQFAINPGFFHQILEQSTIMKLMEGKALFTSGSFKHLIALPISE